MPTPGGIWFDPAYYLDLRGNAKPKYFVVLGASNGDVTVRLLTSQAYGYQDSTYPAFYLGILGGPLTKPTWLDLRGADDIDAQVFAKAVNASQYRPISTLPVNLLCPALLCAATAPDTTKAQENRIYASRAQFGCT
jgi:hypothetical protein